MTNLSQRIAGLSPDQRQQLLRRLQQSAPRRQERPQLIARQLHDEPAPLSSAQQRFWFLEQLNPGSSVYHMHLAFRLYGQLNRDALEQSLSEIARRHAILRTTFPMTDGEALQVVSPEANFRLPLIDLCYLPPAERTSQALALALEERSRPFDLEQGPLWRAMLLRLGAEEHIFVVTMHHIIGDGWSFGILTREISAYYSAFAQGRTATLPLLSVQYTDFARWQHEWLKSTAPVEQLNYWRQQLQPPLPVLQLATDRQRPPRQTFKGNCFSFALPSLLADQLSRLGQEENATLFITLLAAFKAFLARYTEQNDILVGVPIANRNHREIEDLIGLFVNTQVLRTHLDDDPSFRALLRRVRTVALEAYTYQDMPFEQLVNELQPVRDTSQSPIFQVMFTFQQSMEESLTLPGLHVHWLELEDQTAKFDLTLSMRDTAEGLVGLLEYNCDLFKATTIAGMADNFQDLLSRIVVSPDQPLSSIPLLTQRARKQVLEEWNRTQRFFPLDQCVHQLFEEQAARFPQLTAVACAEKRLSYKELDQRANQLAHYLRVLGVGPETPVGVCCERSVELVVVLLGILKAGGVYVPLEPHLPQKRLQFMIHDAQLGALVTEAHLIPSLTPCPTQLVCLDHHRDRIAQEPTTPVPMVNSPAGLAYIIYTSCSSGRPKGVQIPHSALMNLLLAMDEQLGVTPHDVLLACSSLAFDSATAELLLPLISGALLLIGGENLSFGPSLAQQIAEYDAVILHATPATWQRWAEIKEQISVRPCLKILCDPESVPAHMTDEIYASATHLWNMYSLAETTIWPTMQLVDPTDPNTTPRGNTPVIGRPLANTQVYVLNTHLQPVPIGTAGMLYIGGAGLACGYLNHPDRTAERFVPHPFADAPGLRLYKTGDLVRYLPDGSLEFIARNDDQVKVASSRIEPGEIEAVLREHPAINEALVRVEVTGDRPSDQQLIAYVTADQQAQLTNDELGWFLQEQLPDYMLPDAYVLLERMPLRSKVNRAVAD